MSDLLNALYPAQDWCHTHHAGGLWKDKGLECHCYDSNIKAMIAIKASDRCRMMHPTSIMRMKASLAGSCWCSGPALCSFWQLLHSNSIMEDSHFTDTLSLHRLGLYGWFLWAVQSSAREAICLDLCWFLLACLFALFYINLAVWEGGIKIGNFLQQFRIAGSLLDRCSRKTQDSNDFTYKTSHEQFLCVMWGAL